MSGTGELFPGFAEQSIDTGDARIFVRIGGTGPPLLLLHGYPQTHAAWHRVALPLSKTFTIVAADLRGYGRSSCPPARPYHQTYGKRAMALDMAQVMKALGFNSFAVCGQGTGGWTAARLTLGEPSRIEKLVVVDIIPAIDLWNHIKRFMHPLALNWSFLAQPAPLPESLIARDPGGWIDGRLTRLSMSKSLANFDVRALDEYRAMMLDPDRVHATCEDFRASAGQDQVDDAADLASGTKIVCPMLVVRASHGILSDLSIAADQWSKWCPDVRNVMVQCGHWVAEEAPDALAAAMLAFLAGNGGAGKSGAAND